jgi:hypothetical protein
MGNRSFISLYWKLWLLVVAIFLFLRFAVFTETNEELWFNLFQWYALPTWISIMILNMVEGQRLMTYLKNNHYEKWAEFSGFNKINRLKFVFSKDDLDDPEVTFFKRNYIGFIKLTLCVFLTIPFLFIGTQMPWNEIITR